MLYEPVIQAKIFEFYCILLGFVLLLSYVHREDICVRSRVVKNLCIIKLTSTFETVEYVFLLLKLVSTCKYFGAHLIFKKLRYFQVLTSFSFE